MIVMLIPLLLIITLKNSRCSHVIDNTAQQGLYLSDYCPRMKYCKEGSHVMCMYYDPHNVYGPRCSEPTNATVTAEVANGMLDIVNAFRSKIANGKETGKNNELLPRGYGIFRLKWDNELATFAQIFANQCMQKNDLCRATKRFPDPKQNGARVRFTYPHWQTIDTENTLNLEPGLTVPKMKHAVQLSFEFWYKSKIHTTEQMITEYPNWNKEPVNTEGKPYLDMIYGSATHMGCGMTGYANALNDLSMGIFNAMQVICNFSAGARTGQYSYETEPPIPNQGYSPKCGCPPGTKEDSDCLCNEDTTEHQQERCGLGESNGNCDPTLVMLPIFTIEDTPPEKLYQMAEDIKDPLKDFILLRLDNSSNVNVINRQEQTKTHEQPSAKVSDFNHGKDIENDIWHTPQKSITDQTRKPGRENSYRSSFHLGPGSKPPPPPSRRPLPPARPVPRLRASHYQTRHPPPPPPPRIPRPLPPPRKKHNTALKAHEVSILAEYDNDRRNHPPPKLPPRHHPVTKKSNIFTQKNQFTLPNRKRISPPLKNVKSNVISRNNNSNLHKVVNDYVKHEIINDNLKQTEPKEKLNPYTEYTSSETDALVTETGLTKAEEVVINFNEYLTQKNYSKYRDKDADIKDENDNKLLSLLDNLEEEVKHVSFDGNERELFDVKLRKIYGTVIGKTASVRFPKPILLNTALLEDPEIDFGEIKGVDKLEHEYRENKIAEEPIKRTKHHQIAKNIEGVKSRDYFTQKRKNKLIESYSDFKPREIYNHISSDNFDHSNYEDHQYMTNLDHKYNKNVSNKKKTDDNLDLEYNEVQHKFNDVQHKFNDVRHKFNDNNYNREHYYHSVKKHDSDIPARLKKHEVTKAVFREFGNSLEDASKNVGYHKVLKAYQDISNGNGLIAEDIEKIKRKERIHRSKVKSLNSHSNLDDPLDLERRKYYQDKLYNIRKKLRSRKSRRDSKNDRSGRRSMQTNNRESSRTKSTKPDDSFTPEGFLHGF